MRVLLNRNGGTCMVCLFKIGFNYVMWKSSFSPKQKEEDAESLMRKQISLHNFLEDGFSNDCLKICEFLSVGKCWLIFVSKWRLVWPIKMDWHHTQTNLHTTNNFSSFGKQSPLENKFPVLKEQKTIIVLQFLQNFYITLWLSF